MKPNNKIFSATDFIRYHAGKMSEKEMHELEKSALEDNFLSEALDGYMYSKNSEKNLLDINNKINANNSSAFLKSNASIRKLYASIAIAASVIIILFAGYYNISKKSEDNLIIAKLESSRNSAEQEVNPTNHAIPQKEIKKNRVETNATIKFTAPKIIRDEGRIISNDIEPNVETATIQSDVKAPSVTTDNTISKDNKEVSSDDKMTISETQPISSNSADDGKFKKVGAAVLNSVAVSDAHEITRAVAAPKSEPINEDVNYSLESSPLDGWKSYNRYIQKTKKIVTDSLQISCKGLLILSFSINENGTPIDIKTENTLDETCNKVGILLLSNGPKWIRSVNNRVVYKINF